MPLGVKLALHKREGNNQMRFGDRLKQERVKRELTQKEVAGHLNVSRQTISSWETENSYPDIDSLIAISDYYQISLDVLLKEDVGMKEYLKKQEVLDWIKPVRIGAVTIDFVFLGSLLFVHHAGIAGALLLLVALINLLVLMRINRLVEELTGKSKLERWPNNRKLVWPLVIILSVIAIISWYFNRQTAGEIIPVTMGLWLGVLLIEAVYWSRKRRGTL